METNTQGYLDPPPLIQSWIYLSFYPSGLDRARKETGLGLQREGRDKDLRSDKHVRPGSASAE